MKALSLFFGEEQRFAPVAPANKRRANDTTCWHGACKPPVRQTDLWKNRNQFFRHCRPELKLRGGSAEKNCKRHGEERHEEALRRQRPAEEGKMKRKVLDIILISVPDDGEKKSGTVYCGNVACAWWSPKNKLNKTESAALRWAENSIRNHVTFAEQT